MPDDAPTTSTRRPSRLADDVTGCLLATFSAFSTASRRPHDGRIPASILPDDHRTTASRPPDDHRTTASRPPDDRQPTAPAGRPSVALRM
jgi:hypothetical protein